jgi:hypothetical protein
MRASLETLAWLIRMRSMFFLSLRAGATQGGVQDRQEDKRQGPASAQVHHQPYSLMEGR